MTEPSTVAASGDDNTDPEWITRWLHPGGLFRNEPLTDGQVGIELFDGSIYVDNRARLAALGHAVVQHLDAPAADTVAAAGLDPTADPGRTWPAVAGLPSRNRPSSTSPPPTHGTTRGPGSAPPPSRPATR